MKKESLASFMLKEHGKIIALLNEFKNNMNSSKAKETFNALKDKQDNHVFAEERAIIILNREGRKFEEVVTILRQHSEIHEILTKIKENITFETASFELIKKLLDLMKTHVKLENEKFYPHLDQRLGDDQKEAIMKNFHDFIIGNIRD